VQEPDSEPAVDKPDVPMQVHGHDKGQEDPEAQSPTAIWTNGLVSEPLSIEIKVRQSSVSLQQDPDSHVIAGENQVSFSGT
jgi:hypothetical protein